MQPPRLPAVAIAQAGDQRHQETDRLIEAALAGWMSDLLGIVCCFNLRFCICICIYFGFAQSQTGSSPQHSGGYCYVLSVGAFQKGHTPVGVELPSVEIRTLTYHK